MSAIQTPQQVEAQVNALNERLAVFNKFLDDASVQEIAVNHPGCVHLWKRGVWHQESVPELTSRVLETIGCNLANYVSKSFDRENTSLSAYLPSGERIEMTHPPTSPENLYYLNIRKHASRPFSHRQLIEQGYYMNVRHEFSLTLTSERRKCLAQYLNPSEKLLWELATAGNWAEFMEQSVGLHQNIITSGKTGSGKTSYMRSLMELIDPAERILTVEDSPEMPLPNHPNSNSLYYRKNGAGEGASAKEVLQAVMRKTGDRIILAEMRSDEAMYYLTGVLNSGHPGGLTSVHANSPRDAIDRIVLLIKCSVEGQGIDIGTIKNLLHSTVNVVAQVVFNAEHGRHVTGIYYDPMYRLSLLD